MRGVDLRQVPEKQDPGIESRGLVVVKLFSKEGDLLHYDESTNLLTQYGDRYYGDRAAGIATPPGQVTGKRLGTGTTAPTKTGAAAAIVTYIAGSARAIDSGYPTSSLNADANPKRRITWRVTWPAGVATSAGITEAVVTNEAPLSDVAGAEGNTISRVVFAAIAKGSNDTLELSWFHELLGS